MLFRDAFPSTHAKINTSKAIRNHQAHKRLFDMQHSCVELEHEHGEAADPHLEFSNGNDEPHRGFGHLAFLTADVYQASEKLEKAGVSFKKKPGKSCGLYMLYYAV